MKTISRASALTLLAGLTLCAAIAGARPVRVAQTTETRRQETPTYRRGYGAPVVPGTRGLAKYLFAYAESGGVTGRSRQTVVRLVGRPVTPRERRTLGTIHAEVQAPGPSIRTIERAVRNSGFMNLKNRYGTVAGGADRGTRTLKAFVDGRWKTVTVVGGGAPRAFETVWSAMTNARKTR